MRIIGTPVSGPTLAAGERPGPIAMGQPLDVTPALTILDGPSLGECRRLGGDCRALLIGRGNDVHFVIPHPTVSRHHARVFVVPSGPAERVRIVDMGSRNGTFVNGEPIEESYLEAGDKIHLGDVLLRFDLLDPTEARFMDTMATLVREADLDPLTGLYRRSVLSREGVELLAACHTRGAPFSCLMLDLDHFKSINDTYGHPVGDAVLRAAGRAVMESVRAGDVCLRYGGEEIVVLLGRTAEAAAAAVASRIAEGLAGMMVPDLPPGVRVTASQGLAVARFGETLEQLVGRADLALLRAKRAGRNRVIVDRT